jgi:hypothetical protein
MDNVFPSAPRGAIRVTSPATAEYNCVAWAACSTRYVIWPDEDEQYSWPPTLPREETIAALAAFFVLVGYEQCPDPAFQMGYTKIAIYERDGGPTHVARQGAQGRWTSKLGGEADIEHRLPDDLSDVYGRPVFFMRRADDGRIHKLPPLHPPPPRLITVGGARLMG